MWFWLLSRWQVHLYLTGHSCEDGMIVFLVELMNLAMKRILLHSGVIPASYDEVNTRIVQSDFLTQLREGTKTYIPFLRVIIDGRSFQLCCWTMHDTKPLSSSTWRNQYGLWQTSKCLRVIENVLQQLRLHHSQLAFIILSRTTITITLVLGVHSSLATQLSGRMYGLKHLLLVREGP